MPLVDDLARFFHAAARTAAGFRAASRATALTPEIHGQIARAIEATPEFKLVAETALVEVPRFAAKSAHSQDEDFTAKLQRLECIQELRALFRRTRCYRDLWNGVEPDARHIHDVLQEEAARTECPVRKLIPLDGLALAHGQVVDFGRGRLISLTQAEWDDFFEADLAPTPNTAELSNLGTLEIENVEKLVPNPVLLGWEAPSTMVTVLAGHWIAYLDLWTLEAVRPIALYTKPQTLLDMTPVHQISLGSPTSVPAPGDDDDTDGSQPFVAVDVDDPDALARFMRELEAGRQAARQRGPRIETALRWFRRVAEDLFGIDTFSFGVPESLYEDVVVDSFTALEALLLSSGEGNKGNHISTRTASLIAQADTEIATIQQRVRGSYDLRNAIVHGDAQPALTDLERAAQQLRAWVRQVLVAALRLSGDQEPLKAAVTDPGLRASNRRLVPNYSHRG